MSLRTQHNLICLVLWYLLGVATIIVMHYILQNPLRFLFILLVIMIAVVLVDILAVLARLFGAYLHRRRSNHLETNNQSLSLEKDADYQLYQVDYRNRQERRLNSKAR